VSRTIKPTSRCPRRIAIRFQEPPVGMVGG
jgi:hypothetical protein